MPNETPSTLFALFSTEQLRSIEAAVQAGVAEPIEAAVKDLVQAGLAKAAEAEKAELQQRAADYRRAGLSPGTAAFAARLKFAKPTPVVFPS